MTRAAAPVSPAASEPLVVYWQRQLPHFDAEMLGEHVLEATSGRVKSSLAHRDELWDQCYRELLSLPATSLAQEL